MELGNYLARRQLFERFAPVWRPRTLRHRLEAARLSKWAYKRLNKDDTSDNVVSAIQELPGIRSWARSGFVPYSVLKPVMKQFGLAGRGQLLDLLRASGMVRKGESRQIEAAGTRKSAYSYILTAEGKNRLLGVNRQLATRGRRIA